MTDKNALTPIGTRNMPAQAHMDANARLKNDKRPLIGEIGGLFLLCEYQKFLAQIL